MSEQKIALITGANRGIGFETARQLSGQGIKVLLAARSAEKATEAAEVLKGENLDVEPIVLDVDDAATHESAAREVAEKFGRLDILVNNAAIAIDEYVGDAPVPASKTSAEVLRKTFDTNFFNTIAVTQTFLPLIEKSDAGRVVFVSSGLGSLTLHSDPASPIYDMKIPAYDISKTAINAYAVHLAHELKDTKVLVNTLHPGSVVTDMNPRGEITVEEGAKTSVDLATLGADGYTGKFIHLGNELPW